MITASAIVHAAIRQIFVLHRTHDVVLDDDNAGVVLAGMAGTSIVPLEAGWRGVVEVGELDGTLVL